MGQGYNERINDLVDRIVGTDNKNKLKTSSEKEEMKSIISKAIIDLNDEGKQVTLNEIDAKITNGTLDVKNASGSIDISAFSQGIHEVVFAKVESAKRAGYDFKSPETINNNKINSFEKANEELISAAVFNDLINNFDTLSTDQKKEVFQNCTKYTNSQIKTLSQKVSEYIKKQSEKVEDEKIKKSLKGISEVLSESLTEFFEKYKLNPEQEKEVVEFFEKKFPKKFSKEFQNLSKTEQFDNIVKFMDGIRLEKAVEITDKTVELHDLLKGTKNHYGKMIQSDNNFLKLNVLIKIMLMPSDIVINGKPIDKNQILENFKKNKISYDDLIFIFQKGKNILEVQNDVSLTEEEKSKRIQEINEEDKNTKDVSNEVNYNTSKEVIDNVIEQVKERKYVQYFEELTENDYINFNGQTIDSNQFKELSTNDQEQILLRAEYVKMALSKEHDKSEEASIYERASSINNFSDIDEKKELIEQLNQDGMDTLSRLISKEEIELDKKDTLKENVELFSKKFQEQGYTNEEISQAMNSYISLVSQIDDDVVEENKKYNNNEYKKWLLEMLSDKEDFPVSDRVSDILQGLSQEDFNKQLVEILNSPERINEDLIPALKEQIQELSDREQIQETSQDQVQQENVGEETRKIPEDILAEYMQQNAVEIEVTPLEEQRDDSERNIEDRDNQNNLEKEESKQVDNKVVMTQKEEINQREEVNDKSKENKEVEEKEDSQETQLVNTKKSLWEKLKEVWREATNKENEESEKGFFGRLGDAIGNVFGKRKDYYIDEPESSKIEENKDDIQVEGDLDNPWAVNKEIKKAVMETGRDSKNNVENLAKGNKDNKDKKPDIGEEERE